MLSFGRPSQSISSVTTHQTMATALSAIPTLPCALNPSQPDNSYKQKLQLTQIKASPVNHICHADIRAEECIPFNAQANPAPRKRFSVQTKAAENSPTKRSSIVCANCEGNGIVLCSQCKGSGVNSVDHFNGQFKAGATCWLCRFKHFQASCRLEEGEEGNVMWKLQWCRLFGRVHEHPR